jgi:hypothetical protein
MVLGGANTENGSSGSQNPLAHEGGHLCVNKVKSYIDVATQSHDYGYSQTILGLESTPPPETLLSIENL